ncbi:DUF3515 domain-containing protein [Streptomyces sp. NPDC059740]|uniref:DUF3515 domain-containing protein n=1 Tax=Streptomyces sp. NPDC059740 TaxID=3346926 RepID=UPI003662AB97
MTSRSRRAKGLLVGGVLLAGALTAVACALLVPSAYSVDQAPHAGDRACADALARLPRKLLGRQRVETTGAGTAAWGDGSVVLRCGVTPPAPTPDPCMTVDGVDWVLDEHRAQTEGVRTLTTYGREPAVEVTVGAREASPGDVLVDLERAVRPLRQGRHRCLAPGDTV